MALALVEGSGLGVVFDKLFKEVFEVTQRISTFSSTLYKLKTTLISLKLFLDQIQEYNIMLHSPQQETDMFMVRLREAEDVVRKCSTIKWWNLYKKNYYSKKIAKLDHSLERFFQVDVQAEMVRDQKMILAGENDLHKKVSDLNEKQNEFVQEMDDLNNKVNDIAKQVKDLSENQNDTAQKVDDLSAKLKDVVNKMNDWSVKQDEMLSILKNAHAAHKPARFKVAGL